MRRTQTSPALRFVSTTTSSTTFQNLVDQAGGGNYQTLMNDALREYIRGAPLEAVVRAAVREEVRAAKSALTRTS